MVEIRGRLPTVSHFEEGVEQVYFERGDEVRVLVDESEKAYSSKEKLYLTVGGLEQVARSGDFVYFDSKLKF